MKFTQILCRQNMGRSIRKLWYQKRERVIQEHNLEKNLSVFGIQVKDPVEITQPKQNYAKITLEPPLNPKIVFDETHPDWKSQACLIFKDHNVLTKGLDQAQILMNTVCLPDNFSNHLKDLISDVPEFVDDIVKSIIYTSNIFDAHQELLPKRKDPARPAWVFPRDYGITSSRKMGNLSRKLLQLCESLSGPDIAQKRHVLYDGITKLNLDKESDLIQFILRLDVAVMTTDLLKPMVDSNSNIEVDIPSIYPLHHTIGLDKINFYTTKDEHSISATSSWINVHTIFVHCDPVEIKNLTEISVRPTQIHSRTMIKAYIAAASCARQKFGSSVKKLPTPITIQCIQSDGQNYQFSIFQLNSLDLNDASTNNFWSTLPSLKLFERAQYHDGRPVVDGYNPEVFRRILAFYKNGS